MTGRWWESIPLAVAILLIAAFLFVTVTRSLMDPELADVLFEVWGTDGGRLDQR